MESMQKCTYATNLHKSVERAQTKGQKCPFQSSDGGKRGSRPLKSIKPEFLN